MPLAVFGRIGFRIVLLLREQLLAAERCANDILGLYTEWH